MTILRYVSTSHQKLFQAVLHDFPDGRNSKKHMREYSVENLERHSRQVSDILECTQGLSSI